MKRNLFLLLPGRGPAPATVLLPVWPHPAAERLATLADEREVLLQRAA